MPTEKSLYTPESRAVKMAARDIRKTMKHFQDEGKQGSFMKRHQSASTQKTYDEIKTSPLATQLLADGYPVAFALRVAKLEKQQLVDKGAGPEALAIAGSQQE